MVILLLLLSHWETLIRVSSCILLRTHTHKYTCMSAHTHTCAHMHTHACTNTHTLLHTLHTHTINTHTCAYAHTHTCVHIHNNYNTTLTHTYPSTHYQHLPVNITGDTIYIPNRPAYHLYGLRYTNTALVLIQMLRRW